MTISNAVVGNLTMIYLVVIAAMKAYGLAVGRSFGSGYVLALSTAVVAAILFASLTWDVSRKATEALMARDHPHEMCRGGICWHGVAVKSPASQIGLHALIQGGLSLDVAYFLDHLWFLGIQRNIISFLDPPQKQSIGQ